MSSLTDGSTEAAALRSSGSDCEAQCLAQLDFSVAYSMISLQQAQT